MLEDHYSSLRHTEGALSLDQLGYCDWAVGHSRIPDVLLDRAPPLWTEIMKVSPAVLEEFVWHLAD